MVVKHQTNEPREAKKRNKSAGKQLKSNMQGGTYSNHHHNDSSSRGATLSLSQDKRCPGGNGGMLEDRYKVHYLPVAERRVF